MALGTYWSLIAFLSTFNFANLILNSKSMSKFHQRCLLFEMGTDEHQDFIYQFLDTGRIFLELNVFLGASQDLPERLYKSIFPLVTYFRHRPFPKISFLVLPRSHMECSHFATSLMASQLTPPEIGKPY